MKFLFYIVFYLFALWPTIVLSTCPPTDGTQPTQFLSIPEDQYDRNFSSITSVGKRPLGYSKASWRYTKDGGSNPCIMVTGAENRRIEITFEAPPNSKLCVKATASQTQCSDDVIGRYFRCFTAPEDTVYFEFFSTKDTNAMDFWYRIVLGPTTDEDTQGMWCYYRDHDEYPASLYRLPDEFYDDNPLPDDDEGTKKPPGDGSSPLAPSLMAFPILTSLALVFCKQFLPY